MENDILPFLFHPLLSYSMILVEIATRSDLISVSMTALSLKITTFSFPLMLCFLTRGPLQQDQAEGVRLDLMWRPPLPELKAGKADTDCPSQGDYCEVCLTELLLELCEENHFHQSNVAMSLSSLEHLSSSSRNVGFTTLP